MSVEDIINVEEMSAGAKEDFKNLYAKSGPISRFFINLAIVYDTIMKSIFSKPYHQRIQEARQDGRRIYMWKEY